MKIKCRICGEIKNCRYKYYKKRIGTFGNVDKLKRKYICRNCRRKMKEIVIDSSEVAEKVKSLQKTLKKLIARYNTMDLTISAVRDAFLNELKVVMNIDHVTDFRFNAKEGKVQSVVLYNLPFLDDIDIDLT